MRRVVVYDTCALYGNTARDLLIRVASARMVQAKWTSAIIDELLRSLARDRGIIEAKLTRLGELVNASLPDCLVTGYEPLIEGLKLPDDDDRHVLAAAIKCGADTIVTANLKDFPDIHLRPWNITAETPDEFLLGVIDVDDRVVFSCIQRIADSRTKPPQSFETVLEQLERCGLVETAAAVRLGRP